MKIYIVWVDFGCEGWKPNYYYSLKEAVEHESYGSPKVLTILIDFKVNEAEVSALTKGNIKANEKPNQ